MSRRLPFGQLFLAVLLGFTGGVYIYKPVFQQYRFEQKKLEAELKSTDDDVKENE